MKFASVVLCLATVAAAGLMSCGDDKGQYTVEQKVSGVTWPTLQNYDAWKSTWDKKHWTVALSRDHQQLKKAKNVNLRLMNSFYESMLRQDPQLGQNQGLKAQVAALISSDVIAVREFERPVRQNLDPLPLFGFATVKIKGGLGGIEQLLAVSDVFSNKLSRLNRTERDAFVLGFTWRMLENTEGFEFAEPDLESQVQQDDAIVSQMNSTWNLNILGVAELVPQMRSSGQSVVAVIDTGVDTSLDGAGGAFEGRFYRNEGENPANGKQPGVDDDGNGWVDDFYGIDGTIPSGETDQGPQPIPGPNDVGGAGATCEVGGVVTASSCGHGTHVAGIIAGRSPQFIGVCPFNCQILPIRAARRCIRDRARPTDECLLAEEFSNFDPNTQEAYNGGITDAGQLRGLAYILDLESATSPGALATNVVNMSLGKYFSNRALSLIIRRLFQNDVLVVAAAGNSNVEVPMFPAAYRDVVAVCATSSDGDTESSGAGGQSLPSRGIRSKARYSNYGDWVDVCAPGTSISSAVPGGGTDRKTGTSQAAPHVAGVAGLLKALRPGLTAADLRSLIVRYANFDFLYGPLEGGNYANADFSFSPYDGVKVFMLGSGEVSASNAYRALSSPASAVVSQADSAIESGDTAQVTSGCVVSNLAAGSKVKRLEFISSMPLQLAIAWFVLRFRSRKKRPGRSRAELA